jgi:hypothetical protein
LDCFEKQAILVELELSTAEFRLTGLVGRERMVDCGGAAVAVLLRASRLRRHKVTGSWWRVDADGDIGVPELDGIQKSALFIQNLESALRSWRCCE